MGWAKGRYYRRSVRQGRRVATEYFGAGWFAEAAAHVDRLDQERRRQARQEAQALRETLADSGELTTFNEQARLLIDAALVAAGYYRHKRQWRRRRGGTMEQSMELSAPAPPPLDWRALKAALVAADAQQPAPGALAELRQLLASHPNAWRAGGDLARAVRQDLISRATSLATQESTKEGLHRMRKELRGERSSAVEDLAIDAILTAWVDYHITMLRYGQLGDTSVEVAYYWQRRVSLTQGRYLRALRTLATIRKAGIHLQINIADQQVNINREE